MKSKLAKLRDECDHLQQELNRKLNENCLVCGNKLDTGHHFVPKSLSARLRYDMDNLIPICNSCHMKHHRAGDPSIHRTIILLKGDEWYDYIEANRRKVIKVNVAYYEGIRLSFQRLLL